MCRTCTPKKYSTSEAQDNLPKIINEMEDGRCVELTQEGKPVAVLVSARDYERLSGRKLGPKPDLWEAIQKFRAETNLEELDIDSIYKDVRDRSPDGR